MRILLVNPPYHPSTGSRRAGAQVPLGLLAVGGPLLDAGHHVALLDAQARYLGFPGIVDAAARFRADLILTGHAGSTPAHPIISALAGRLKAALPTMPIVYGGVYPSYHAEEILAEQPAIDIVVRGEGEATVVRLVEALKAGRSLSTVPGLAYRQDGRVRTTPPAPAIADLDAWRVGWELIEDWDLYRCWGARRAAIVQFSRGCPHLCTYCGQNGFWSRWRHRSPQRVADEIAWLHRTHGVGFVNLADENPTSSRAVWRRFLQAMALPLALLTFMGSGRAWKPLLTYCAVLAALAMPYLLWNLIVHGDLMPISGRIKLYRMRTFLPTWDAYWASDEWQGMPRLFQQALPKLSWKRTVVATAGLFVSANVIAWSRWGRRQLPDSFRLLSIVVVAHAIYMYVGYRELRPYTSYYFSPELLFTVLVLAWSLSSIRGQVAAAAVVIWILVISNVSWEVRSPRPAGFWSTRIELAQQLPDLTGGEPLAAFWPGAFAAFSGLNVVPLDGVIGSKEFFDQYVKTGREIDYLREHGIRWVVVAARTPNAVTGSRKPRVPDWSEVGRIRLWEARHDLRHAHRRGNWHLFELQGVDRQ